MESPCECAECGAALQDGANFCSHCGQPVMRGAGSVPPPAGSVHAPPHLRNRVLAGRAALEGERKQVTVLFADLRSSLAMLAGIDPEDGQALLDAVLSAMVEAVHRYEGAVNQVMGDGIMALFGAPIAHEDHALRAACAALAMQEAVRALRDPSWEARGAQPQIRVGLHAGEVAVRAVHNDLSMDYRAVGETTHIAARMEQLAPPGAVWMTEETVRLGQGRLRTTLIGPTPIKGVTAPIVVHELNGISILTRFQANALRGLSSLAGREELLLQLEAAFESARAGRRGVAVLSGEPGVGKSRLCHELLQRAQGGVRVLEASSFSYLSARPHGLLASILRALIGIDDTDTLERVAAKAERFCRESAVQVPHAPAIALELLDVPARDNDWSLLDPQLKRRRISQLVRELLQGWCARGFGVLLCEDLHWCDRESLEFITALIDETPPQLFLLLTHRPEFVAPWRDRPDVLSCHVRALDAETSERLLSSLLGESESLAPLRSWLVQRTDGNPFFIEESARALIETGMIEPGRSDVPASIEALLSARVDRLPEHALELLQAAAVLDDQGPTEIVRAVAQIEPSEFRARLDLLTRAELLYQTLPLPAAGALAQPSPTVRFKHALIQEVVYKRLVRPRRRALHARALEVMEKVYAERLGEHVERLAEHAFRADLWARSVEYRRLACLRAVSRGANALAIEHLDRGLEALRHWARDPEQARAAIDLRLNALAALLPAGAIERAITLLDEAAHEAEELADLGRLARVSSQLSAQLWCVARYDEAKQRAQRALEIVRQLPGDQFALESAARYNTVMVQHAQADFVAARAGLDELLARFADAGMKRRRLGWAGYPSVLIRTFVISVAAMTGSFADAARAFEEGLALAEELRHAFSRTMIMEQYSMCLLAQGEVERARELLARCLELCQQEEVHAMYPASALHLGLALLEQNAVEEARVLIESIDDLALARAGHYATDYRLLALSELARRSAAPAGALQIAEHAVAETVRAGEPGFQVRALVQLGDVLADDASRGERALAVYGQAIELAERLAMRPCNALALQGMARVHAHRLERERARRLFERAGQLWTELACPARLSQLAAMRGRL